MLSPVLSQATVLDLVPFGNTAESFFALRLSPLAWQGWKPGQFVMLRPAHCAEGHVWARPFSICQVTPRDVVIFFQVVGKMTSRLAKLVPGDLLDIWGPLGNALHVDAQKPTLLLAGGIGIAPFVGYAHAHPSPWNLSMEFGHRLPLDCYPFDSLNEKIYADAHREGTPADRDAFIALMDKRIADHAEKGLVLACGPTPFLQTVQALALKHKASAQLCLETKMACGIGACLGCVVQAKVDTGVIPSAAENKQIIEAHQHVQTCTCGPNFWADAITI